jgi:hypothetical protein
MDEKEILTCHCRRGTLRLGVVRIQSIARADDAGICRFRGVIRSQTAGGKYAVDMGMMLQPLIPGVEHAEEAYLGSFSRSHSQFSPTPPNSVGLGLS